MGEDMNKLIADSVENVHQQIAKEKFITKKIGSFYFIIDTETGNKCITEKGKRTPFRTTVLKKVIIEMSYLQEGYKKQLQQEGEVLLQLVDGAKKEISEGKGLSLSEVLASLRSGRQQEEV
ncbi:coil containing protein [Vibrio phage 1.161.O._10N.261.48.C5]|nr:coil containing protein [Vibrio phage 1.161.O._10N.261.48.C5]